MTSGRAVTMELPEEVPQDSWRTADEAYAYRVGFDRGFRGQPLGATPAEVGARSDVLAALALGHDRGQSRRAARTAKQPPTAGEAS